MVGAVHPENGHISAHGGPSLHGGTSLGGRGTREGPGPKWVDWCPQMGSELPILLGGAALREGPPGNPLILWSLRDHTPPGGKPPLGGLGGIVITQFFPNLLHLCLSLLLLVNLLVLVGNLCRLRRQALLEGVAVLASKAPHDGTPGPLFLLFPMCYTMLIYEQERQASEYSPTSVDVCGSSGPRQEERAECFRAGAGGRDAPH